jgi:ASTRA-associated protein 1
MVQEQEELPPPQPQYVFRGHTASIHAVVFLRDNTRILTGDADGWVVLWSLTTKRPRAVWQAHQGPILRLAEWSPDRIIT